MSLRRWFGRFGAACAALLVGAAAPAAATSGPAQAAMRLRWEVERNVFPPHVDSPRSKARFTLTNLGSEPLAQGWALYFSCIAGVTTGPTDGPLNIEQVTGTLYRLRPAVGFGAIAPGQTLVVGFIHPEIMFKADKAPRGPYLVLDSAPDVGLAVADYRIEPPTRPEQLERGAGEPAALTTAEEIFRRNAVIADVPEGALPPVFPSPRHFERRSGSLALPTLPVIVAPRSLQREAAFARAALQPFFSDSPARGRRAALRLQVQPIAGQASPEAYKLTVDPARGISLVGNTPAGVFRGLQSLRDLLPVEAQPAQGLSLPALGVTDAPRFEHRGVLLDVARNFHRKETVFKLLDLMARLKLNKLHFHLTDDEGWRLAIAGLPELTEFGARRGHSADPWRHLPPAYGSGPDVDDAHGSGHYSHGDYLEILRYAAARHIDVIPEIEMPGHARAAVKAMEARTRKLQAAGEPDASRFLLSDPADRSVYRSPQLYSDHVMNPGLASTYAFIEHVVAEVAALHKQAGVPLRTLHVGADELPGGTWEQSPACEALRQRLKLADRAALWNHFYDQVDRILRRHGLAASGWEELGAKRARVGAADMLVPNPHFARRGFTLYVWNNLDEADDLAYRLANAGYDTVLAPATTLYFDMAHNRNPEEPGVNWAAYVDLDTVFDYVPLDAIRSRPALHDAAPTKAKLSEAARRKVRGLEITLFSETLREPERLEFMLMPRLLGLAERAWARDPAWATEADAARAEQLHAQAWSVFVNQVGKQVLPRLEREMPGYNFRIPPPGLARVGAQIHFNSQVPGFTLRYTTDGSEPTTASPVAHDPIAASALVSAGQFDRSGRRSSVSSLDQR